jgi:hypothetical protein
MRDQATISGRVRGLDWDDLLRKLDEGGYARTPPLLTPGECDDLIALYDTGVFRKRVDMGRHQYGEGEYQYFGNPLPDLVTSLREGFYARLAPLANRWVAALSRTTDAIEPYPLDLEGFLERCHEHGQGKPTPLLLRYGEGGYNCLHQDLYGPLAFPLQVVFVLSRHGVDYTGGEFLLVEQRPRAQSRGEAIVVERGEALIFPNRDRPVAGARGFRRVNVRHGISTLRSGRRFSLGIIFHDAE